MRAATQDLPLAPVSSTQLRLISLSAGALLCAALTYLAATRQFSILATIFPESPVVEAGFEPRPPAPPPRPRLHPPPAPDAAPRTVTDPTAPPTPTETFFDPDPQPPAPAIITNPTFLQRPSGRDFERFFPPRALARGVSGRVVLDCTVAADGRIACAVASEEPVGWGFGEASLRAARQFRVAPATADGRPTSGGRISVPMMWRAQ
ncbi:MAG: energy transducer TonB [Hyphomonadaceae bacterium]